MGRQTIILTGASDGIGAAAARQLSAAGEHVVLVGRSAEKTEKLASELGAPYHLADFGDLSQVRALGAELLAAYPTIDVLANNAGGIFDQETTRDGFDKTFQVNHLAGFLLTHLLMDRLVESRAKVVQTSSIAAKRFGNLDLDDLDNKRKWTANKAYGDSKLANILFTQELQRRYGDAGINAVAFHPGNVATNFASDTSHWFKYVYRTPLSRLVLVTSDRGGAALTWLVEGTPGITWQAGEYYEGGKIPGPRRIPPQAKDTAVAKDLWDRSTELIA